MDKSKLGIIEEILFETEDQLRAAKLKEAALLAAILKAKKNLEKEEEKKDPNRKLFSTGKQFELQKATDDIRNELFHKQQTLTEVEEEIKDLQNRKQQLLLIIDQLTNCQLVDDSSQEETMSFLELQEKERLRIANDLHDSTVQTLTALIHKTELTEYLLEVDPIRAKIELTGISEVLKSSIQEIREVIYDLRQTSMSELGLWSSIREYMEKVQKQNEIQTKVMIDSELEDLSIDIEKGTIIYKIVQEVITNSVKHAEASGIEVTIRMEKETLLIDVTDDGIGLKKENMEKTGNYGLKILKERTDQLSGKMEINTSKKGTEFVFMIPMIQKGGLLI